MSQLDKIEKHIRNFIEKSPALVTGSDHHDQMVKRFSEAIQALFMNEIQRDFTHPRFQFNLGPETAERWRAYDGWEETLADLLIAAAKEYGFQVRTWPEIELNADAALSEEEIIISLHDLPYPQGGETGVISMDSIEFVDELGKKDRRTPTLILQGNRTIELTLPVINMGRKSSNHIVINDLRISRNHAQLRKLRDTYMLFDIGSSGGTFINGTRIERHVLRPGDVISLAGYTMIFTIDQSPPEETQKGITSELKNIGEEEEK